MSEQNTGYLPAQIKGRGSIQVEGGEVVYIGDGLEGAELQGAWVIDPLTGSDDNSGLDTANAIATGQEYFDRIGSQEIAVASRVLIANDLGATNPFHGDLHFASTGTWVLAGTKPLTTLYTGSITNQIPINAPVNQIQQIEDTSSTFPAGLFNSSVAGSVATWTRITSAGARLGAINLLTRAGVGASTAVGSAFIIPDAASLPLAPAPTVLSPINGETFVVETGLASIADFSLRLYAPGVVIANSTRFLVRDIAFPYNTTTKPLLMVMGGHGNVFASGGSPPEIIFARCDLGRLEWFGCLVGVVGCKFDATEVRHGQIATLAGLMSASGGPLSLYGEAARSQFIKDTLFDLGGRLDVGVVNVVLERVAFCNAVGASGDAIVVNAGCSVSAQTVVSAEAVYGSGNAQYGVRCRAGGVFGYQAVKPTVAGTVNDSIIGGTATAWGAVPFYNVANGAGIVVRQ